MPIISHVDLLKRRRTKIIATVGPSSREPATIKALIKAGVNLFRLNMSHGDHDFHRTVYGHIRAVAETTGEPISVLADLCGPKIRTGKFSDGAIHLRTGEQITVTTRDVIGTPGLIPSQYRSLSNDVKKGDRILLSDGNMELRVEHVETTEILCTVIHGGTLKDQQGINLPGVNVSAPSLTEKDIRDARFAIDLGVEYLALSFVRRPGDIDDLREIINAAGASTGIIAKIEKPEALKVINAILDVADGIMVARGDLGVELPPEEIPIVQAQLIERAKQRFKPVIVATQMLESMIEHSRPTRAEVTDISHAVTQSTDAVMLSAETAAGAFPVEAVTLMDRIIRQTEAHLWKSGAYASGLQSSPQQSASIWDVISNTVNTMAHELKARAVMVLSHSGMSAATMSAARPAAPIVAITNQLEVCRRMALFWGVIPVLDQQAGEINPNLLAREVAMRLDLVEEGQHVILVRGFHSDLKMNTPTITALVI